EDSWQLLGFASAFERGVFQRVLDAKGGGPALAIGLLSALSAERLVRAIREKDVATLQGAPRVGRKKADQLILDLAEKMDDLLPDVARRTLDVGEDRIATDAVRALVSLGYSSVDAGGNLVGFEQGRSLGEIRELETRQALASIGITSVWLLRMPDTPGQDVNDVLRSLASANHGSALAEAVRFIRMTRPEVVITMLPDVVVGENHEDHQAAAIVATEAFDLAGDPTWFPEQLGEPEARLWYGNLIEGLR